MIGPALRLAGAAAMWTTSAGIVGAQSASSALLAHPAARTQLAFTAQAAQVLFAAREVVRRACGRLLGAGEAAGLAAEAGVSDKAASCSVPRPAHACPQQVFCLLARRAWTAPAHG